MATTRDDPARSISRSPPASLGLFEHGVSVDLIATPRAELHTCRLGDSLADVLADTRGRTFHVLPVTRPGSGGGHEPIVGLLELDPFRRGNRPAEGPVEAAARPLTEDDLIGADAGILGFIREADRTGTRLVVSGPAISGIVTLSDLQRLPARACLFAMVTHLEMVMTDAIRAEFGADEDWRLRLSEGRQAKIDEKVRMAADKDVLVEALLCTEFADKLDIITGRPDYPWSKNATRGAFDPIIALRDSLAHVGEYAATRDDAHAVCATVRAMDLWISRLTTLAARNPEPPA